MPASPSMPSAASVAAAVTRTPGAPSVTATQPPLQPSIPVTVAVTVPEHTSRAGCGLPNAAGWPRDGSAAPAYGAVKRYSAMPNTSPRWKPVLRPLVGRRAAQAAANAAGVP